MHLHIELSYIEAFSLKKFPQDLLQPIIHTRLRTRSYVLICQTHPDHQNAGLHSNMIK